jgi:hypothetical protein
MGLLKKDYIIFDNELLEIQNGAVEIDGELLPVKKLNREKLVKWNEGHIFERTDSPSWDYYLLGEKYVVAQNTKSLEDHLKYAKKNQMDPQDFYTGRNPHLRRQFENPDPKLTSPFFHPQKTTYANSGFGNGRLVPPKKTPKHLQQVLSKKEADAFFNSFLRARGVKLFLRYYGVCIERGAVSTHIEDGPYPMLGDIIDMCHTFREEDGDIFRDYACARISRLHEREINPENFSYYYSAEAPTAADMPVREREKNELAKYEQEIFVTGTTILADGAKHIYTDTKRKEPVIVAASPFTSLVEKSGRRYGGLQNYGYWGSSAAIQFYPESNSEEIGFEPADCEYSLYNLKGEAHSFKEPENAHYPYPPNMDELPYLRLPNMDELLTKMEEAENFQKDKGEIDPRILRFETLIKLRAEFKNQQRPIAILCTYAEWGTKFGALLKGLSEYLDRNLRNLDMELEYRIEHKQFTVTEEEVREALAQNEYIDSIFVRNEAFTRVGSIEQVRFSPSDERNTVINAEIKEIVDHFIEQRIELVRRALNREAERAKAAQREERPYTLLDHLGNEIDFEEEERA